MPQIGERRSGATETVEWDGQRWQPVEGGAAPQQEGALSRFLGGALSTSPLNPMNLVRAAAHPVDTLGHLIGDPLNNLFKAGGDVKAAVTGERGDRLSSALQAVEHLGGAVPLIGPAGIQAGEKIGNGDIAGGAGELAGLASGALVPDVASGLANNVPGAMIRGGEAVARGGAKLKGAGGVSVGGIHVPLTTMGLAEAVMRGDPKGLAVAAAPYAMEYGGKGMAATGRALEGLRGLRGPKAEPEGWDPAGPSKRAASQAAQQAARQKASNVQLGEIGDVPYKMAEPELTGNDIANATDTYNRAVPGEFANRSSSLGQSTLKTMRDAGYEVPEGGFQSLRDIDNLAKGPRPTPDIPFNGLDDLSSGGFQPNPVLPNIGPRNALTRIAHPEAVTPEVLDPNDYIGERLSDGSIRSPESQRWETFSKTSKAADAVKTQDLARRKASGEVLSPEDEMTLNFERRFSTDPADIIDQAPEPPQLGEENFDFLTSHGTAPLSTMERLGARSAERFGRRYRPEF